MDPNAVLELVKAHSWLALTALIVGGLVRLSMTDAILRVPLLGKLIAKIPVDKRSWLALGLAQISAVLDMIVKGTKPLDAIVMGLIAAAFAVFGHEAIAKPIRQGVKKAKTKVPVVGALLLLSFVLTGCPGAGATACAAIDVAKTACDVLPIRYLDANGQEQVVLVRKSELASFAAKMAAERVSDPVCDGGCGER